MYRKAPFRDRANELIQTFHKRGLRNLKSATDGLDSEHVRQLLEDSRRLTRCAEIDCNTSDPDTRKRAEGRERGALKRIAALCEAHGLYWYHQQDPRGCALYVSSEPLSDQNYPNGIAVC